MRASRCLTRTCPSGAFLSPRTGQCSSQATTRCVGTAAGTTAQATCACSPHRRCTGRCALQGNVYVWKFEPGSDTDLQPVTMFSAHSKYITKVLLSPDVKYVSSAQLLMCRRVHILTTGHPFSSVVRHLATCSADKTIKIWSTENFEFKLERVLEGHQRWVWDCAYSADSAYLVTGAAFRAHLPFSRSYNALTCCCDLLSSISELGSCRPPLGARHGRDGPPV